MFSGVADLGRGIGEAASNAFSNFIAGMRGGGKEEKAKPDVGNLTDISSFLADMQKKVLDTKDKALNDVADNTAVSRTARRSRSRCWAR